MQEKDFKDYDESIPALAEIAFKSAEEEVIEKQGYVVKVQKGFVGILYKDGTFEPLKEVEPSFEPKVKRFKI